LVLVELSVVEQRYRVVLAVEAGATVSEVARQAGVSRQTVHTWLARYATDGLGGLVDRSKRPESCPHQLSVELEAAICELRREHPRWGPRRLQHELGRSGRWPVVPARVTVYRVLVRHGLISPGSRRRRRQDYRRWERDAPMALWQLDIVGGVWLTDGTDAKVITGVDDHSRYCVIAQVVARATGRAVCLAFAGALRRFGVPEELLTDNGKQFTARFGHGGEVLFDRICRDNGIVHRLTRPASPTTTGKVERFHQTLRRELLDAAVPFTDLATAQAAIDAWVADYNTTRPHQALAMACPAERFAPVSRADQELLRLRLPATLTLAPPPPAPPPAARATDPAPPARPPAPAWTGQAVEFDRIVPASGNLGVAGKQFWLGPAKAGVTVTFWADSDTIHLLIAGTRIKSLRSHLSTRDLELLAARGGRPAGPPPLPPADPDSGAVEVDRTVNASGLVSLAGRHLLAAEILAGRRVTIRLDGHTLQVLDPDSRELLRTRPNPLTAAQARQLQGAPPQRPTTPTLHRPGPGPTTGRQQRRDHDRRPEDRAGPHPRRSGRHRSRQRHHPDHRPRRRHHHHPPHHDPPRPQHQGPPATQGQRRSLAHLSTITWNSYVNHQMGLDTERQSPITLGRQQR
jgi:transposase InsO family protein